MPELNIVDAFVYLDCQRQEAVFGPVRSTRPFRLSLCHTAKGVQADGFELVAKFLEAKSLSFLLPPLPKKRRAAALFNRLEQGQPTDRGGPCILQLYGNLNAWLKVPTNAALDRKFLEREQF